MVDLLEQFKGYRIEDDGDDDPQLVRPDGEPLQTWREGYPYAERMTRHDYDHLKRLMQIELLKLQNWMKDSGERLVVIFEGRDAAGKGGTIKRFMEHLNPRGARCGRPGQAQRAGVPAVVLPALRGSSAGGRRRWSSSTGPGTTGPAWNG